MELMKNGRHMNQVKQYYLLEISILISTLEIHLFRTARNTNMAKTYTHTHTIPFKTAHHHSLKVTEDHSATQLNILIFSRALHHAQI